GGVATDLPIAASAQAITAGPDGNIWFATADNRIGRMSTAGVVALLVTIPTPSSGVRAMAPGRDGNVWFAETSVGRIGRITPTGQLSEFVLAAGSTPLGMTPGPDGNVWFSDVGQHTIARITPTGVVTSYAVPAANTALNRLTSGPDGNIWFVELNLGPGEPTGSIGRLDL